MFSGILFENVKIALNAIRSQLLRTSFTISIIAFGIIALVGTLSSIDAIKSSINSNFTRMGANTFTIRSKQSQVRIGQNGKGPKGYRTISYDDAVRFKNDLKYPAQVSISVRATMAATVKWQSKKTNPNIFVLGVDENYIETAGYEIEKGRNFSQQDIMFSSNTVLIGQDVRRALFEEKEKPLDKFITIGSAKYRVIGVLKEKGNSKGFGGDKMCLISVTNARDKFSSPNASYAISVLAPSAAQMDAAIGEATGLMRSIRKIPAGIEDNFEITKSDNLATILISLTGKARLVATIIAIITLLGAAIGLINSMLVSVSERTREIGVRKSLGATSKTIRSQFLIEAIVICLLGGIAGIIVSIILGNLLSIFLLKIGFIIPWLWMFAGIVLCFIVGLAAGLFPAIKASKLDPIEALRSE